MNSVSARSKFSKLERITNKYILLLLLIQVALCLAASIFNTIWTINYKSEFGYLDLPTDINYLMFFAISFGTWFLAFMNFIPISLLVTLEVVKFL